MHVRGLAPVSRQLYLSGSYPEALSNFKVEGAATVRHPSQLLLISLRLVAGTQHSIGWKHHLRPILCSPSHIRPFQG